MRKSFLTLLFFITKLAISTGLVYLAYWLPGKQKTTLTFVDYMVDIDTGRLAACIIIFIILAHYLFKLSKFLVHLPARTRAYLEERRLFKSKHNTWDSYIALSAGETQLAIDLAEQAYYQDPSNLFAKVISAQASLTKEDTQDAEVKFQGLLLSPSTRFLGLKGLIQLKQKQHRDGEVYSLLKDALSSRPQSIWTLNQLLAFVIREGDFEKASEIVGNLKDCKELTKEKALHQQGILHYLKAKRALTKNMFEIDKEKAEDELYKALKLAPQLTAASLELAILYLQTNRFSKAQSCLMKGYAVFPHVDYLAVLKKVTLNKTQQPFTPMDRYQFAEEMVSSHPDLPQSHIILASLALEAHLWGQARFHLNLLGEQQRTQSYHRLLGELESKEPPVNAEKAAKILEEGMIAPADPQWVCKSCHSSQSHWAALCDHCHRFDGLSIVGVGGSV